MEKEEKLDVFKRELLFIKTTDIKTFTRFALSCLPGYFFTIPASSSGKYHPSYALGDGGLVRHTKAAVRIANELLGTKTFGGKYTQRQKDMIISALILHDGLKSGWPKQDHTVAEHPNAVCDHLEACANDTDEDVGLEKAGRDAIYALIKSHMGEWNTNRGGAVILPKPETSGQGFVHLCDYLASRKMLEFNFDV